jgi:hypothetical protein
MTPETSGSSGWALIGDVARLAYYVPYFVMVVAGLWTGRLSLRAIRKRYRHEHSMPDDDPPEGGGNR